MAFRPPCLPRVDLVLRPTFGLLLRRHAGLGPRMPELGPAVDEFIVPVLPLLPFGALIATVGSAGLSVDVAGLSLGEAADVGYAPFPCVLPGDSSGRLAVLLFDGVDQGLVLVQGFRPAVACKQRGPWCVDEVRGQAVQQIPEHGIVGAVPYGGVELEIGGDPGVVIRVLKLPVPLQQSLEPHEVRKLAGFGCLPGSFFFKKDSHVIDLDDLLRVYLRNLQPPGYPLKEVLMLEAGQRLPDGCPGDAEALSK